MAVGCSLGVGMLAWLRSGNCDVRMLPLSLLLSPLQHPLSSAYLTIVNQKFPEDQVEHLQAQVDAITQL